LILSVIASTGSGGDQPYFEELLTRAWRRSGGKLKWAVANAGYDSEENLRLASAVKQVRAIIPPRSGRPTDKPPPKSQPLRRRLHHRFAAQRDKRLYGQRWQVETVNSMIKRTLGSALRARTAVRRRHELLLRVLTHNIMLLAEG
jgi:hypothetical protein